MSLKKLISKMDEITEAVEKTATGLRNVGTYGTSFDPDAATDGEKPTQVEPAVKRGRGRPRKDSGEPRWDTDTLARWIIGSKPAKLPGKASVKHRLKEWMDVVENNTMVQTLSEGRMAEVHMVLSDIASGEVALDQILDNPMGEEEKFASHILHNKLQEVGGDMDELFSLIKADFGEELNEIALDQSQVALPQIKAPGAPAAGTGAGAPAAQTGAAVVDFKDPKDPLKVALQKAVANKEVAVLGEESINSSDDGEAEKLKKILANYPMEHRMALEGWGLHEALYQALCDHYWDNGRIPREKMHMGGQQLHDWVEECWSKDTMGGREQVDEFAPALIGSALAGGLNAAAGISGAAGMGIRALGGMAANQIANKFTNEVQESLDKYEQILSRYPGEVAEFKNSGDLDYELESALWDYHFRNGDIVNYDADASALIADQLSDHLGINEGQDLNEEKWIKGAIKHPGAFAAKAKSHGMTTKQFIKHVLANKDDFPAETERQANLAKTLSKFDESAKKDGSKMDSATFWKLEAEKAKKAGKEIDWEGIGKKHGRQGKSMNPPYGVGAAAVKKYSKGLEAGKKDPQGVAEGTDDSTQVLSDIVANEDFDALYDLMSSDTKAGIIVQRMYNDVSGEERLHPDDDFEEILSIVLDRLTQDYGQQGVTEGILGEKITKKTKLDAIISDFVDSKDKRFKDKSKKERIEMAKGAYYGMHPELKRGKDSVDKQMESWNNQLNSLLKEGITFSTSTGSGSGGDSVTISATDSDASDLMKLIQNSGLIKTQADSMAMPSGTVAVVDPVSHDEVMDTLEPEDDGASTFDFIKRMVSARNDGGAHSDNGADYESEAEDGVCTDCGHSKCECPDHGDVTEADNYEQTQHSSSDHSMSPVPEAELVGGQKKLDVASPHGKLTAADFAALRKKKDVKEDAVRPEDYTDDLDEEADDWADAGEQDLAAAVQGAADAASAAETEKSIAMSEGGEICNECGGSMYEGHQCSEDLTEWANTVGGSSKDESFIADMEFMTKAISGGLNNIKQDQTVLPSARVKTDTERFDDKTSMAELLRKLQGMN